MCSLWVYSVWACAVRSHYVVLCVVGQNVPYYVRYQLFYSQNFHLGTGYVGRNPHFFCF